MTLPEALLKHPHFSRYYRTWKDNPLSVVFVPLAQISLEQGYVDEALQICESGLSHQPQSVSGRLMLARLYLEKEELEKAKKEVDQVLTDFPAQPEAQILLQRIERSRGPIKTATPQLTASTSLWENFTMAKIYADQGEKKIALKILDKILAREPTHENARALKEALRRP